MSVIEWFTSSRNKILAIFAGLLFFAGWWVLIDAMSVNHKHQITTGHVFIGVFGTLSLLIVNSVKNSDIAEDSISETRALKAKIFLLTGFLMGFAAMFAAVWVMIVDFINNPEKSSGAGVALLVQNVFILLASLSYKLGRNEESWD